jgi:hypothetical protein
MNGKFGFPTIWGDNKVDVVSTATAIEVVPGKMCTFLSDRAYELCYKQEWY